MDAMVNDLRNMGWDEATIMSFTRTLTDDATYDEDGYYNDSRTDEEDW